MAYHDHGVASQLMRTMGCSPSLNMASLAGKMRKVTFWLTLPETSVAKFGMRGRPSKGLGLVLDSLG